MTKLFTVKATGDFNIRTFVSVCGEAAKRSFITLCNSIIQGYATLGMTVDVFNINDEAVLITVNGKFADMFEGTIVEFVKEYED